MRKSSQILLVSFLMSLPYINVQAQDISVDLGTDEVGLNELYMITITLQNE